MKDRRSNGAPVLFCVVAAYNRNDAKPAFGRSSDCGPVLRQWICFRQEIGIKNHHRIMQPSEKYLEHLDAIFQQEPEFYSAPSTQPGLPGITAIVYRDIPEPGFTTAFTYGLSLVAHPDWKLGRPELCISVASDAPEWGIVVAEVASRLRGDCPFTYGQTINYEHPIAADTEMSAFFVFAPSTIDPEDYLGIDTGAGYKINIASLYPIYGEELQAFEKLGLKEFWHHPNYDNYSVSRQRIDASIG
jgi:hypothetical protein